MELRTQQQNPLQKHSWHLPGLLQQLKFQFPLFHMQTHLNLDEMMSSFCITFTVFLVSEILSHKFTYKAKEIHPRFHNVSFL